MDNIEEVVQNDDSVTFLNIIMPNLSNFNNYSQKGSKKNCIFCKCAYHGYDSCLEASLSTDIICNHSEKHVSYYAAAGNQIQTLVLLQNYNAKFERAVFGSLKYGKYQSFMWLLENNYDDTIKDLESDSSIFFICAKGGNAKIFQYLLENYPQYLSYTPKANHDNANEDTLLRVSTKYNHSEIVDLIISLPEYSLNYDIVPIINSIKHKNVEMTRKLINISQINKSSKSKLFDIAIDCQNIDIILLLSEKYNISLKGVIFKAVSSNSVDFVKQILEKGVIDINEKNEYGVYYTLFKLHFILQPKYKT